MTLCVTAIEALVVFPSECVNLVNKRHFIVYIILLSLILTMFTHRIETLSFHCGFLRSRESQSSQTCFVLMVRLTLSQTSLGPDLCICLSACSIHPWPSCQLKSGQRSNSPPCIMKTALKAIIYW